MLHDLSSGSRSPSFSERDMFMPTSFRKSYQFGHGREQDFIQLLLHAVDQAHPQKKKKHARSTETEGSERRPREFRRSSSVDVVRKTFGPSTEDDEMTRALKFDSQRSSRPQACKHAKLSEAQQQGYKKKNTLGGLLRGLYICCTNLSSCSLRINLANGAIPTKNWKSGRRPSH